MIHMSLKESMCPFCSNKRRFVAHVWAHTAFGEVSDVTLSMVKPVSLFVCRGSIANHHHVLHLGEEASSHYLKCCHTPQTRQSFEDHLVRLLLRLTYSPLLYTLNSDMNKYK